MVNNYPDEIYHDQRRDPYYDWSLLSPEEAQIRINRSRNYLRYNMAKNRHLDLHNPNLTTEERFIIEQYNDHLAALTTLKVTFFNHFYKNCSKVGSTLKRKVKKTSNEE